MKFNPRTGRRRTGSTLIAAIIITALLGLVLAAYLHLLTSTNAAGVRSQAWNQAIPIVEAGIEDALTHLNVHGATGLATDGWQAAGGLYWVRRAVPGGTYVVTISNFVAGAGCSPIIESRGFLSPSATLAAACPAFVAAVGVSLSATEAPVARGVRVATARTTAYPGLFARYGFEMQNTTGLMADSYDSSDPTYSTGGLYDPRKAKPNTYLGTISKSRGALNIHQTAKIIGKVGVGASGVLNLGSPASIGDSAWVSGSANAGKVQPGHLDVGVNIPFPPNVVPFTSGYFTPSPATVDGTAYAYVLNGGNYRASQISLASTKLLVTRDSALHVDRLTLNGGEIILAPNVTLKVYVTDSFMCSGNARLNANGRPSQFLYYGLPGNESFQISGNAFLSGVFNSPSATAQFQQNAVLCGAAMFYDNQMQHNVQFHYDEALGRGNGGRLFIVTSWLEMEPAEVRALPAGVSLQ